VAGDEGKKVGNYTLTDLTRTVSLKSWP
jgi:hypothetical protein